MRVIQKTIFKYEELSDGAKEKARDWYKDMEPFSWNDEWRESMLAYCGNFGVKPDWNVGPFCPVEYSHNATNSNFRGLKLATIDRDRMLTGFCGDCDFWYAFYDGFKQTGDALAAFDAGLYAGLIAWRNDWEYAYSDEAVEEAIICNEYEFDEKGNIQ